MAFGKEFKRLKEESGFSAGKIADLIGVNADRLRKWMELDHTPRPEDAAVIEAFFEMPLKEIAKLKSIKDFLKVPRETSNIRINEAPTLTEYIESIKEQKRMAVEHAADLKKLLEASLQNISSNINQAVAGVNSLLLQTGSMRSVSLRSLARIEKKPAAALLEEADNIVRENIRASGKQGKSA